MTDVKQRILVTGGAGFLGSHLCARLVRQGHHVTCVDSYLTSERYNLDPLRSLPNFTFIEQDIIEPLRGIEVDRIYNLACPASPPHYQHDPVHTFKTSVLGMMNMLELARTCNARVLQASTSEVYGDPDVHPQPESYRGSVNPIGVRSCYDEGKRAAETLCFDYFRMYKVDIRVVRIFNTYGPNMHPYDGRVVSNFILQALRNEDITIYGDGQQTRSFCYVDDLLDAMTAMMNRDGDFLGPVNTGNPGEFTIKELAQLVIELTGSKSRIVSMPLPKDDPKQRKPDITLAKEKLGWEPKVKLADGLKPTIAYFASLDLSKFRRPTPQTAHTSSERE